MSVTASPFGTSRLFLADARLAYLVLNNARYRCLHRAFGVSHADANLLTAVFALGGATAAQATAHKVMHPHLTFDGTNAAAGGILFHDAIGGFVGPSARKVPMFGTLLAVALVGGAALPGLRRAAHAARLAEHRARAGR